MKTNLSNSAITLLRHDKEIEKEQKEIQKLDAEHNKKRQLLEQTTIQGEKILDENKLVEEEKKKIEDDHNQKKEKFNQLKRDMQRVEDEEAKAKQMVEEALKQRKQLDDLCKKQKVHIKENREKFKQMDNEFGFVFRTEEETQNDNNRVALINNDSQSRMSRVGGGAQNGEDS